MTLRVFIMMKYTQNRKSNEKVTKTICLEEIVAVRVHGLKEMY